MTDQSAGTRPATYIAIHQLLGVTALGPDVTNATVFESENPAVKAVISEKADEAFAHIDRKGSFGKLIFNGFTGLGDLTDDERLDLETQESAKRRLSAAKPGVFVVFEVQLELPVVELKASRVMEKFGFALDAYEGIDVAANYRSVIDAVLTSIALSIPDGNDGRTEFMGGVVFLNEDKPIYLSNIVGGSINVSTSARITQSQIANATGLAGQLSADGQLERSSRLAVLANRRSTEALLQFLAAWAALEVFVSSLFAKQYEKQWYALIDKAVPPSAKTVLAHIEDVMKSRIRLMDRFAVVVSFLDPDNAAADIAAFSDLKKFRDGYFHALDGQGDYPTAELLALHRKYLKLHLAAKASES
jgi:hypothetical protein